MRRAAQLLLVPRPARLLARIALLAAGAVVLAVVVAASPLGERLEGASRDARARSQPALKPPPDVVVVGIDSRTGTTFNQWPINLQTWTLALESLDKAGAKALVLDVPFETRDLTRTGTAEFLAAVSALEDAGTETVFLTRGCDEPVELSGLAPPGGSIGRVLETTGATLSAAVQPPTRGAVLRSTRVESGGGCMVGVANASLIDIRSPVALERPSVRVPDPMHLSWYGGPDSFEHLSFIDLTTGAFITELRGRTIFVGRTDGVSRDGVRTAVDASMPHVVVEATAFANARDDTHMVELPSWAGVLATGLLALLTWALLVLVPIPLGAPLALAGIAGWGWYAWNAWGDGLIVPMVLPLSAASVVFIATASTLAYLGIRERLRVKGLFARYVPADVVRELIDRPESIELGGQSREITVLFSDIRGFTSLSEHADPNEMVTQLNEYFAEMVDVVTAHRGTLDKFLGDGLMAIFGAPVAYDDHASRACHAALDMLERLEHLNTVRARRGLAPLGIGIGIHTGHAVVGNVGSPLFRVDFTAIGDTVNLAARLEGATKEVGATIVVSGDTVRMARERPVPGDAQPLSFVQRGSIVVKGRTQATEAWELLAAGADGTTQAPPDAAAPTPTSA